jgi:hypothetical protein
MKTVKKNSNKEFEIFTKTKDITISVKKGTFLVDIFKSKVNDPDLAHIDSTDADSFEELTEVLKSYKVSQKQINTLKEMI